MEADAHGKGKERNRGPVNLGNLIFRGSGDFGIDSRNATLHAAIFSQSLNLSCLGENYSPDRFPLIGLCPDPLHRVENAA
jgi:hypothetical protein